MVPSSEKVLVGNGIFDAFVHFFGGIIGHHIDQSGCRIKVWKGWKSKEELVCMSKTKGTREREGFVVLLKI